MPEIAGRQGYHAGQHDHTQIDLDIDRLDLEQDGRQEPRGRDGASQTKRHAGRGQNQTLTKNETQYGAAAGAERHPQAYFLRSEIVFRPLASRSCQPAGARWTF